jgi:transposase
VNRAKILLLSDGGRSIKSVGAALSADRQVVRRWRKRFVEGGIEAIKDRPRRGRPRRISTKVWVKIAVLVVQAPSDLGLPFNRWTVRDLSAFIKRRYRWKVSRAHIGRFLRGMALKPHRIKYWLNPKDPDFDAKAVKVCRLYLRPPRRATVICLDEKPGVKLRSRIHPTRRMAPGRVTRVEFEYRRHGTRCIFAAFNPRTGKVLVQVTRDRKVPRLLAFLDLICRTYRRGRLLIITDNVNTRSVKQTKAWLKAHSRVTFVFTPKHGSWLNQVEIWFSILTKKCLRGRPLISGRQLAAAVRAFARRWNNDFGHPFKWTYTGKPLHA